MVFEGLISSSVNSGSRTETGLGRSGRLIALSKSSTCLVVGELDGDANEEDCPGLSSYESWKTIMNETSDKLHIFYETKAST